MDKMSYPRGLIRFTSENQLQTASTHFVRPRLFGYLFAVIAMVGVFAYTVAARSPVSVDIVRDRGARLYRMVGDDVQNVYTVKINNMDERDHTYTISVQGDLPFQIKNFHPAKVLSGEVFTVPIRIGIDKHQLPSDEISLTLLLQSVEDEKMTAQETTIFFGPGHSEKHRKDHDD